VGDLYLPIEKRRIPLHGGKKTQISKGEKPVSLDEIKSAIKVLPVEDRRKVALYILELEKDHAKNTFGPQISADLDAFSKVLQDSVEKIKTFVNKK
jgi:hypothetical protein